MAENDAPKVEHKAKADAPSNPYTEVTNDLAEGRMIISAPNGKGEREIAAADYPKYAAADREWVVKHTNYVGAHHSDNVF